VGQINGLEAVAAAADRLVVEERVVVPALGAARGEQLGVAA